MQTAHGTTDAKGGRTVPPTAFFIDLDGVVYRGSRCLEGAAEFIARLETGGHPYVFLTNNSAHHPDVYVEKLHACGIPVDRSRLYTAADAAADSLRDEYAGQPVFVLGETGLLRLLHEAGVAVTGGSPPANGSSSHSGSSPVPVAAVLLGEMRQLDYAALCEAARLVAGGADLLATNPDRTIPVEDGFILGCGALTAAVEAATGRRARYFGKPDPGMARRAARRLGVPLQRFAVIGDNWETDIGLAHGLGLPAILVQAEGAAAQVPDRTGPAGPAGPTEPNAPGRPVRTVPSLAALVEADLDAIVDAIRNSSVSVE